jgi:hypothetical protein
MNFACPFRSPGQSDPNQIWSVDRSRKHNDKFEVVGHRIWILLRSENHRFLLIHRLALQHWMPLLCYRAFMIFSAVYTVFSNELNTELQSATSEVFEYYLI